MLTCGSYTSLVRLFSTAPCVSLRVTQLSIAHVTGHFALPPAPRPGAPGLDPSSLRNFAETLTKRAVIDPSASFVTFVADVAVPTPPPAVPHHTNLRSFRPIAKHFALELLEHPNRQFVCSLLKTYVWVHVLGLQAVAYLSES